MNKDACLSRIPSVEEILKSAEFADALAQHGRKFGVTAIRHALKDVREAVRNSKIFIVDVPQIAAAANKWLEAEAKPKVQPVFNLTGTVLHTNLGRAVLAEVAIVAATTAMRDTLALEFDLGKGKRSERDALVRDLLCELTGAQDATVVNNNAAAVLLVLNTLANGKETIVSRGELIEIGGNFRMPEIMARAGTKLVEIGTTNRTHEKDYVSSINSKIGLVLKVHTSNYKIKGFTKEVSAKKIVEIARKHKVPLVNDLGSGTLVDLGKLGLGHEPTVADAVAEGASIVTFSGDKLLGGPQAGFIVGRKELITKINKNPMKRALRIDKIRLAALEATLRLYRDPDRLAQSLPTIRHLVRKKSEIEELAIRLLPAISNAIGGAFRAELVACTSQIGSGSLPQETISSAGIAIQPTNTRSSGRALNTLAASFRALPLPVIGRIEHRAFILDFRCLEDEKTFAVNLAFFKLAEEI